MTISCLLPDIRDPAPLQEVQTGSAPWQPLPHCDRCSVLLLGCRRPTLPVARALAPLGYRIIVGRAEGEAFTHYSRHVSECWEHPPLSAPGEFLAALNTFLAQRTDILVIYPIWEDYVRLLAEQADRLPADRIVASPSPEIVHTSLDKVRMARLASGEGVPTARFAVVDTYEGLIAAASGVGFPLVVRPRDSQAPVAGKKALICATPAELADLLPVWPAGHSSLLIQHYVDGIRHNHYFAAQRGTMIRLLETRIARTDQPDGTGVAVAGETMHPDYALVSYTEKLVRSLDYTGIGLIQYVVDPAHGEVSFVELNPRISGSHAIAEAMGLELSRLAIELARTPEVHRPLKIGAAGTHYTWLYGAIRGYVKAGGKGEISLVRALGLLFRSFASALTSRVHLNWCWNDPLPTLMLFANQLPRPQFRGRMSWKLQRDPTV